MRCSAPPGASTSRRSASTPRTMRPRSTTTRCATPGTACARRRGSRSTANRTLAFGWTDLAPSGETFWAQTPSSARDRRARRSERQTRRAHTLSFLRFPAALSGRCKENIEEWRSRAEVPSLRRATSCRVGWELPANAIGIRERPRVAHRLLRRLHDRGRSRRLYHRPHHRTRVWRPGQPYLLSCALFSFLVSVLVGFLCVFCLDHKAQSRRIFFFSSRRRHTRFDCDWS